MSTNKRQRQKAGREARIAAAQAAQRKAKTRQRTLMIGGIVVLVLLIVGILALVRSGDDGSQTASTTIPSSATSTTLRTTTTVAGMESAAGKPCVPLADPLPAGAPEVPITPGPPPTELVVEDLVVGDGPEVPAGDPSVEVTVQYIGVACSTGKIFDSSWQRGAQPATFPLGGVIDGWTEGIPGMKVGGRRLLVIPSGMAYGPSGSPPRIAPDEALYFVVDLEAVVTDPGTSTP